MQNLFCSMCLANNKWKMGAEWLEDMEGDGWEGEEKFPSQWHDD